MILLIDNYDSFSYNLYQLVGSITPDIRVIRNNELTVSEIDGLSPDAIILSPGPGRPENAGVCIDVVKYFADKIPILGICLGHQAICMAFGGVVTYAERIMHGKTSEISVDSSCRLFEGLPETFKVARYHSLVAEEKTLPKELKITAKTRDGVIMALEHVDYDIYGLQFHPESILTPTGKKIAENFLEIVKK